MTGQRLRELGARRKGNPSNLHTRTPQVGKRLPGLCDYFEIVEEAKRARDSSSPESIQSKVARPALWG